MSLPIAIQQDNTRFYLFGLTNGEIGAGPTANDKVHNMTDLGDLGYEAASQEAQDWESRVTQYVAGLTSIPAVTATMYLTDDQLDLVDTIFHAKKQIGYAFSSYNEDKVQTVGYIGKAIMTAYSLTGLSTGSLIQVTATFQFNSMDRGFIDPIGAATGVAVSTITVKGKNDATTITTPNGTLAMIAIVAPSNATNKGVIWSVDDSDLAEINLGGILRAVKDGEVTVTATAADGSGITGTTKITISNQPSVVGG